MHKLALCHVQWSYNRNANVCEMGCIKLNVQKQHVCPLKGKYVEKVFSVWTTFGTVCTACGGDPERVAAALFQARRLYEHLRLNFTQ